MKRFLQFYLFLWLHDGQQEQSPQHAFPFLRLIMLDAITNTTKIKHITPIKISIIIYPLITITFLLKKVIAIINKVITASQINIVHHQVPIVYTIADTI